MALCLVAMLCLLPAPKAHAFSYYYETFPSGKIGLAQPEIGMAVKQTDSQLEPSSFTLYVNGKEVKASYNNSTMRFSYTPEQELAPGTYKASIIIQYPGYLPLTQSWEFTVTDNPIAKLPDNYNADQRSGLAAINDYRLIYGLPPLTMNPQLATAAQKHAEYLDKNSVDGQTASLHEEKSSLPGYIGATLRDRALYVGYTGSLAEDASLTYGTVQEAIDKLFDAPYHRSPFLDPNTKTLGIAKVGHYTVLEFGKDISQQPQLIVSPAVGDAYVPIQFDGHESPDPIRIHSSASYPVGYPLLVAVTGENVDRVSLQEAKLTDPQGKEIELLANTPATDDHLIYEVILLPKQPLALDTSYTASVKLTASLTGGGTKSFAKQWTFHTEPSNGLGKRKLHAYAADYKQAMTAGEGVRHMAAFGLDGSTYTLDNVTFPMKVKPYIENGTSYLWVRDLAAALGADIEWNDTLKAAVYKKKGRTVTLYTTKPQYDVNGVMQSTDAPAKLVNNNTMVPVRLLSEALGAKIDYDNGLRTVYITYQ
ncbi:stalk domain-containing protein [Gordoniibacillus kamchatkensis]|uniref:stalk domain-containing protein n=1 Tax=Gordoniibacillus kamchatkensis TaxID=1590651 RepID=UPI0012E06820|nr:stalk domain-containing protein [Paenibacillus sp. VKM B-2647]